MIITIGAGLGHEAEVRVCSLASYLPLGEWAGRLAAGMEPGARAAAVGSWNRKGPKKQERKPNNQHYGIPELTNIQT